MRTTPPRLSHRGGDRGYGTAHRVQGGLAVQFFSLVLLSILVLASAVLATNVLLSPSTPPAASSLSSLSPFGPATANLTVTPSSGFVDTFANASGSGYAADSLLNLTFNGTEVTGCVTGSFDSNATGNFSCGFTLPEIPAGAYAVNASDGVNNGTFTVTVLPPTLALAPSSGFVANSVIASGTGYDVSTLLRISFGGTSVAHCGLGSLTTNSTGDFSCRFPVPFQAAGPHSVDVSDRNNTASQSYTILSPTLVLTPNSGTVGSSVVATGSGYDPTAHLTLTFGPAAISSCTAGSLIANATGKLSCTFPVPVVADGANTVLATDGLNGASATYTVGAPTLTPTPSHGNVGSSVTVSGSGYARSSALTLNYSATPITTCTSGSLTSSAAGAFSCAFTIPASVAGSHTLKASDGTNTATALFTVDPHVTLSISTGTVGASVTVTGTGFDGLALFTVTWDASPVVCTGSSTDSLGDLTCTFDVPESTAGTHTVMAAESTNSANAPFTVNPSVTVNPTTGPVGTAVTITGLGFAGTTSATVSWDSTTALCTSSTNATGGIVCDTHVPSSPVGSNTISITQGAFAPTAAFTVTSTFSLSVSQGIVGTVVTLVGNGLAASTSYRYCLQSTQSACPPGASFTTDPHGTIPAGTTLTIPSTPPGSYYVDVSLVATLVVSAPFTVTSASLSLVPTSGPVGTSVVLSGSDFVPSTTYDYCLQATQAACGVGAATFSSDGSGNVPAGVDLVVPATPGGIQDVDVSQGSTLITFAPFTITSQLVLSPTSGTVGSSVLATANGLDANAAYVLTWNSTTSLCSGTTNSSGAVSCAFLVPGSTAGTETVTITEGSNAPNASFNVVPQIVVLPASGPTGTPLTISGTGFLALTSYAVQWNATVTICSGTTDDQGNFGCLHPIPASPVGPYTLTATAGASSATAVVTVTSSLTLSVSSGPVNAVVTATGTGFDADSNYALAWNLTTSICSGTTQPNGEFTCLFTTPQAPAGVHTLTATEGANTASAEFVIVPSLLPSSTIGLVGSSETVTGTGFDASSPYTLTWDSATVLCSSSTDANGSFGCTFIIPSSTAGAHRISVSEGSFSPSVTFTVTSSLSLNPTQGAAGIRITATGTGFGATSAYTIRWNGGGALCSGTTSSEGGFSCTFNLPTEPGGAGTVTASQGSNQASTTFTIVPAFTFSLATGTVGSLVNATGSGFVDSSAYAVMWNSSTTLCAGLTNSSGGFTCNATIPAAPAGLHTVSVVQATLSVGGSFVVTPGLAVAPTVGATGSTVTISGSGFDADARYLITWNSSTTLCSGSTNTNGAFVCTFTVPSTIAGPNTITISEGTFAPTISFVVAASPPPPPSSGTPFPWWIVVLVVIVIAALLVAGLVYEQRRHPHHHPGSYFARPSRSAHVPSWTAAAAPPLGSPVGPSAGPESTVGAAGVAAEGEPEDIDHLMARLERMSVQLFKKTPKELGEQGTAGESNELMGPR
jgi:hypothetical protein